MGRPKTLEALDPLDVELILECKRERKRLRQIRKNHPAYGKRNAPPDYMRLVRDIDQLSDRNLAEKFEVKEWVIHNA